MIPIKTESAWRGKSDCRNCGMRDMVLFADLNEQDFGMIHAPIDDLEFKQGATLYDEGSRAQGVFTVRTGMIKLVRVTSDGRHRIVRVLRPGDVAGLEALATSRYDSEAVALTDVAVCRIPLDVIHTLGASSHRLHHMLMQKWQKALKDADDWLADLNFGTARQRVSNLILKMRSPADSQISILFARDDMGAMLNLKLETVSREVSRLVREEVIAPQDRQGRVYRVQQLARLQVT
ncbi:MAG: Crp/Fnr family transcriptional regulator [Rhodoferax sp.]|uniref:Crp/Fnr family transcriptional regulator n=2 Tax=Rhodoferax sp. TaxID=50421 RepID=UPI0017BD4340|nr:Crp/Fnr family transcriptional regulator [Rhodoferax sp.]NMM12489.1 Crp/Fnr family transcriptional regulator [Rhodoferax sp.]NMM21807.1 Crp/Fnr family transcriptional regulator [Rhodoferax sp.]